MSPKHESILIIGANFAGLTAAIQLPKTCDVTVVDPSPNFEWTPGIHEILSGVKTPQGLRLDRADIIARAGHRFVQDRVTEIDTRKRRVTLADDEVLDWQEMTGHYPVAAIKLLPGGDRALSDYDQHLNALLDFLDLGLA